jgi:hypothetical protein
MTIGAKVSAKARAFSSLFLRRKIWKIVLPNWGKSQREMKFLIYLKDLLV